MVETKGGEATNKLQETIVTVVRHITIPTGSIISLVLLLIITREGIRYRQEATQPAMKNKLIGYYFGRQRFCCMSC